MGPNTSIPEVFLGEGGPSVSPGVCRRAEREPDLARLQLCQHLDPPSPLSGLLSSFLTAPSPWHVGPTVRGSQPAGEGLEPAGAAGVPVPPPPSTTLPAEPLISHRPAPLLMSSTIPLPRTRRTGCRRVLQKPPARYRWAGARIKPPSREKGLGQLRLTVCRRTLKRRNPNYPQSVTGLIWRHKRAVLQPPVTAHARTGPGHSFVLWGNFLRFLIITGN